MMRNYRETLITNNPTPPHIVVRIELMAWRVARGLDIWSGKPTREAKELAKEMRAAEKKKRRIKRKRKEKTL